MGLGGEVGRDGRRKCGRDDPNAGLEDVAVAIEVCGNGKGAGVRGAGMTKRWLDAAGAGAGVCGEDGGNWDGEVGG